MKIGRRILFASSILVALFIMLCGDIVLSIYSHPYNVVLHAVKIKINLWSGEPLPYAVVTVKPSIYSSEKDALTDITNENGEVTFYNVPASLYSQGYSFWLSINYGIYGEIYSKRIIVDEKDKECYEMSLTLPYTTLQLNYSVLDELYNPLTCIYHIVYAEKNMVVYSGKVTNGSLSLKSPIYTAAAPHHYLLINTDDGAKKITYNLLLKCNEKSHILSITSNNLTGNIILDLHPPRVSWEYRLKLIAGVAWINIYLNVSDGFFSTRVDANVRVLDSEGKTIREMKARLINSANLSALYGTNFSLFLSAIESEYIYLEVTVIDPGQHVYYEIREVDLKAARAGSVSSESSTTSPSTPVYPNTSTITISQTDHQIPSTLSKGSVAQAQPSFNIPQAPEQGLARLDQFYFIGFAIAGAILYIELKRRLYKR